MSENLDLKDIYALQCLIHTNNYFIWNAISYTV